MGAGGARSGRRHPGRARARPAREQLAAGVQPVRVDHTVASYLGWWESTVLPGTVSEGSRETYRRLLRL